MVFRHQLFVQRLRQAPAAAHVSALLRPVTNLGQTLHTLRSILHGASYPPPAAHWTGAMPRAQRPQRAPLRADVVRRK